MAHVSENVAYKNWLCWLPYLVFFFSWISDFMKKVEMCHLLTLNIMEAKWWWEKNEKIPFHVAKAVKLGWKRKSWSHILFRASRSFHHKIRKSVYNRYITQKPLNHMGSHVWLTALKSWFLGLRFMLFSYSNRIAYRVDENWICMHFMF